MSHEPIVYTRREFLRTTAIASMMTAMPSFLTQSVRAGAGNPLAGERVLVVVQLGGGNDGLNTIVPHTNDAYHLARPRLALKPDKLLKLTDDLAMNAGLKPLMRLFEDGRLAIINGVGYPNPNRSHFRSMEIWHTASDADRYERAGWAGRYFDNCCGGAPHPLVGVNVGGEDPQAFTSERGAGVSFVDPANFRWLEGTGGDHRAAFEAINRLENVKDDAHTTLDFLRHTTANAVASSDRVIAASKRQRDKAKYPNSRLSNQLQSIASMIAAGLPTRIYYTSISGFDTHAAQADAHARLLDQFGAAVAAFQDDLRLLGQEDRVVTMCFSEFGRRVEQNASNGTDHGTAGPLFLLGSRLQPGLHGSYPSLTDLDSGDLKHTVDFRSVYTELVEGWLNGDGRKVVGRAFPHVGVLKA